MTLIRFPSRPHVAPPVIDLDRKAQVFAFPNRKTRAEIAAMDERLAYIALRVRGMERQAAEMEAAREALEALLDGGCK